MANKKSIRPKLFQNEAETKRIIDNVRKALIDGTLSAGMKAVQEVKPKDVEVRRKPKYLEVTEKRLNKLGVIDLKPYFANSHHAKKKKKGGGWYLIVPIQRNTRSMSRRMYEQLRQIDIAPDEERTVISDYLYDRRRTSPDSKMINYEPVSYNITKKRIGKNRHSYTAFRTVSDKSPFNSWIINRNRVNKDDQSKTFVRNVDRLMKWKMKNGWQ